MTCTASGTAIEGQYRNVGEACEAIDEETLVVPISLIGHHVRRHEIEYLIGQVYLEPHPRELMLRNHV